MNDEAGVGCEERGGVLSCEVISDPRYFGGAPAFFCYSNDGFCGRCGLPSLDDPCEVCELLRRDRMLALKQARFLKFAIGPFCQFCESDEETVLCDWPEMKPTRKRTELAEVGDVWITQQRSLRGRIAEIVNLDPSGKPTDDVFLRRQVWVSLPGHRNLYPYNRANGCNFTTETLGTCDRQCCWRHQREVGENRHYCKAHWDSWQGVTV